MIDARVLAFAGIAALITVTPGSDTMLVIRSALVRGRRAGLLTVLGVCAGVFVHATASALGLSAVLVRSARAFDLVKAAGAAYLVFLGVQSIRSALRGAPATARPTEQLGGRRAFVEGLLNNVLNPKVAVFYLAFLPQFMTAGDPVLPRSILLAAIHFVEAAVWLTLVAFFVARLRGALARPRVRCALEGATGLVLVAFGVKLAAARR